jgi:hypothetical protein
MGLLEIVTLRVSFRPYFVSLLAFKVSLDSCNKIAVLPYLRLMMNTVLSSMTSSSPICCKCSSRLTA